MTPAIATAAIEDFQQTFAAIRAEIARVVIGHEQAINEVGFVQCKIHGYLTAHTMPNNRGRLNPIVGHKTHDILCHEFIVKIV